MIYVVYDGDVSNFNDRASAEGFIADTIEKSEDGILDPDDFFVIEGKELKVEEVAKTVMELRITG